VSTLRSLARWSLLLTSVSSASISRASSPEGATRVTLANGMRVVIVKNSLAPVATIETNILAGSNESPARFPGMAHAQEHMAFRGCLDMTADQTATIYAQLGDENNADTQQNVTQFYATVPAADIDVALEAQSKCLQDIDDSQAEWKRERGALEEEIDGNSSDPIYNALYHINRTMFAGTPYAHDPLGDKTSFERTTGVMLRKFYRKWYVPSNVVLVVVGDIDPEKTLATITELFGHIQSQKKPSRPSFRLRQFKSENFTLNSDMPYTLAYIAYRLPGTDSSDYAATIILADILASRRAEVYGMVSSGLAMQVDFGLEESYRKASIGLAEIAVPPGSNFRDSLSELRKIITSYAHNGVPKELVEAARRSELAQEVFQSNSIPGLADLWSNAVAVEGRNSPRDDFQALRNVTLADVNRVARRYLVDAATITVTLEAGSSESPETFAGPGNVENATDLSIAPVQLPEWAAGRLEQLRMPQNDTRLTDTTLANGIRLIVRTDSTSPTVTLFGSIRHDADVQTPVGQEGISNVLEDLYGYGSEKMDQITFQTALDDIAANEEAGYRFSLSVFKNSFSRGVELLADNELNPDFSSKTFATTRQLTAQRIMGDMLGSDYRSSHALNRAMVPRNDPTLRNATPETLGSLTLEELKAYQRTTVRPDLTTIVIVGDISSADARAVIEHWFGAWRASGPTPITDLPSVPLNLASTQNVVDVSLEQDSVVLAQQLKLGRADPDYYALQLGTQILDGGFYASRLYHDLRQTNGFVYGVDVDLSATSNRASYTIRYNCDPEKTPKVRAIVERDLNQMRTENVSDQELHQAKALLLRQIPLKESSVEAIASDILDRAQSGLPLEEPFESAKKYFALTADDIRIAFAKLIRTEDLVQVVRGPRSAAVRYTPQRRRKIP
jgi:zinc protease